MKQSDLCNAKSVGWWQIPEFSNYLIGDAGEVYTLRGKGRLMKLSKAGLNYRKVILVADDGSYHHKYIHHLVADSFGCTKLDGQQMRHLDGNPENNCISNLVYGTPAENAADKLRHGTDSSGERNGMAKLTKEQVLKIRDAIGSKPQAQIARDFGVSPMSISRIVNNQLWKSV